MKTNFEHSTSNIEHRTGKIRLLSVCLLTSVLCLLTPGCSTTSGGSATAVATMSLTAKSAAFVGATLWLQKHPETRPQFEQARSAIKGLIAAGTFNAADLSAALKALPIRELKGDAGTLIVSEAVVLWDQYGKLLASVDSTKAFTTYVLPVASAIEAGLDMALGN